MNVIKKKLNSKRGASITYALMIFLVCAVIGSAVLVAGTTAAGRMSEVPKSDQRYYAVTSAARLLIDRIENDHQPIIIKQVVSGTTTTTTKLCDENDTELTDSTEFKSIPLQIAYYLMKGTAPENELSLTINPAQPELSVDKISEKVSSNGEITITISKTTGTSSNARTYSLQLVFNLDKNELPPVETSSSKTTTYQFTWHLRDVQVVGAQRW